MFKAERKEAIKIWMKMILFTHGFWTKMRSVQKHLQIKRRTISSSSSSSSKNGRKIKRKWNKIRFNFFKYIFTNFFFWVFIISNFSWSVFAFIIKSIWLFILFFFLVDHSVGLAQTYSKSTNRHQSSSKNNIDDDDTWTNEKKICWYILIVACIISNSKMTNEIWINQMKTRI